MPATLVDIQNESCRDELIDQSSHKSSTSALRCNDILLRAAAGIRLWAR